MAAHRRTRQPDTTAAAPTFEACTFVVENISPQFDPKRVLLRRTFFTNDEQSRYVSVGFYPTQNYQPLVELGGAKIKPITLTEHQVNTLAIHLPRLCQELCTDGSFHVKDGEFTLKTTATNRVAKLTVAKQSINLKLEELIYLSNMFHVVQNQLTTFIIALSDVMYYVSIALSSTVYVEPTAAKHPTLINYALLYEELKTPM
jgi:hypothetical protein